MNIGAKILKETESNAIWKKTMYYDQVGFISGKGERKREQEREIWNYIKLKSHKEMKRKKNIK